MSSQWSTREEIFSTFVRRSVGTPHPAVCVYVCVCVCVCVCELNQTEYAPVLNDVSPML